MSLTDQQLQEATQMRVAGATYSQIGIRLGVSQTRAYHALNPEKVKEANRARREQKRAWDNAKAARVRAEKHAAWLAHHEELLRPNQLPLYRNGEFTGQYVIVDDDVWERLRGERVYLHQHGYAVVSSRAGLGERFLHRWILGQTESDQHSDHINRNKLDNRRENLRVCTHSENMQNRIHPNRLGMRGVHETRYGTYFATATLNRVTHHLGTFATAEEAGAASSAWRAEHMPFSPDAQEAA